jgi:hypothetical protein
MSNVRKVAFEFFISRGIQSARMISFNTDPDTGSKSIHDILEADMTFAGSKMLARTAAEYDTMIDVDVEYTFRVMPTTAIGTARYLALDKFDTGKNRNLESKILHVMNVVNSENDEV